jgi:hypothetical protein
MIMKTEQQILSEMIAVLISHGPAFSGGDEKSARDIAQDWIDHDFDRRQADAWCEIGVWDAHTAAALRDAKKTPAQVAKRAEELRDAEGDGESEYTDGSPIYSVCNNDTNVSVLIV